MVAVAALGLFVVAQQPANEISTSYVVATSDIAPGTRVTADMVGLQRIDLPSSVAAQAFGPDAEQSVLGAVTVSAIRSGELLQSSDVRPSDADAPLETRYEISFEIDATRALDGALRAGESVDLIATKGAGPTAETHRIQQDVVVLAVSTQSQSLTGDQLVLTVGLATPEDAVAVASAIDTGQVTVVRAAS